MVDMSNIPLEESQLVKNVLGKMHCLKSLSVWYVCNDSMLDIIGMTCHTLSLLDIYKSSNVTDAGVRLLLACTERSHHQTPWWTKSQTSGFSSKFLSTDKLTEKSKKQDFTKNLVQIKRYSNFFSESGHTWKYCVHTSH